MTDSPSRIRCFIAIELSEEARTALSHLQKRLKEVFPPRTVRWTVPKNIHLTLHFLGDVSVEFLDTIGRILNDVAASYPAFSLDLSDLGCFPNTRRPRIVWVGVSGEKEPLVSLHHELGSRLEKGTDLTLDSRPYSPHLTIGRVRKGITPARLRELGLLLEQEIPRVRRLAILPVHRIDFIRSDLKPDGPVYTRIADGKLRG